jgi:hypothetical protein
MTGTVAFFYSALYSDYYMKQDLGSICFVLDPFRGGPTTLTWLAAKKSLKTAFPDTCA